RRWGPGRRPYRASAVINAAKSMRVGAAGIYASNALSEEQFLDAVDMAGALPNQPLAFPMGAARIFFLDAWYSDDGGDMALAPVDGDQRAKKCEGIDTVGLHTTGSAVSLYTCRVEHSALNAELGQRAPAIRRERPGQILPIDQRHDRKILR